MVVGLSEGSVDGVTLQKANDLRQAAHDFTTPVVRTKVTELSEPREGKVLLVVQVEPGEHVHETTAGDCYLRVGDESRRLSFAQRRELEFDRGVAPYDGTPTDSSLADLDPEQVEAYRNRIGSSTPERVLEARNLITRDGRITVAGLLLFANNPQVSFPNAYVRVLRYTDSDRGSGSRLTLDDTTDIRCEGSIPQQIMLAEQAIDQLLPRRRALSSTGRFEGVPSIPRDAWLEGLVNAVVHRSYSLSGDHIRVEIFPDRLEITSPGRFPGLADPTNPLSISRHARNPRVARVCSDLGITKNLAKESAGSSRTCGGAGSATPSTPKARRPFDSRSPPLTQFLARSGHPYRQVGCSYSTNYVSPHAPLEPDKSLSSSEYRAQPQSSYSTPSKMQISWFGRESHPKTHVHRGARSSPPDLRAYGYSKKLLSSRFRVELHDSDQAEFQANQQSGASSNDSNTGSTRPGGVAAPAPCWGRTGSRRGADRRCGARRG